MRLLFILFFCALMPAMAQASFFDDDTATPCISAANASFEAVFSGPGAGALSPSVVRELASAKKSIRVSARDFTSKPISEALIKATRDGRDVKVVLDAKHNNTIDSAALFLVAMNNPPHFSNKDLSADYIIIDENDIILGNIAGFVDNVEEQNTTGNVLIIHNAPDLAQHYLKQWQILWSSSQLMKPAKD